jgi:putative nucleotide binding protein
MMPQPQVKRYEEYAYVLDFMPRSKSKIVKNREGLIVQVVGEDYFTLLELLAFDNATFSLGERIYIGKEKREKIASVLGKLMFEDLTQSARNELPSVLETIVIKNEQRFVSYFNNLQPITPRLHALELIPGVGRTLTVHILDKREQKPFDSFADVEKRTGLKDPAKQIAKRLLDEIQGKARINIFLKRWS